MAKAKYELFRDAKAQVSYDVQRTWYELFKVREEIRISEKNIEILRTIERLSLVKYKSPASEGSSVQPGGSVSSTGSGEQLQQVRQAWEHDRQPGKSGTPLPQAGVSLQCNHPQCSHPQCSHPQ